MARKFTAYEIKQMMDEQSEAIVELKPPIDWLPDLPEAERAEAWRNAMESAGTLIRRDGQALDRLIR